MNKLFNETEVSHGDTVRFINSDGEVCEDIIQADKNDRLFFWNNNFNIEDYKNAELVRRKNEDTL